MFIAGLGDTKRMAKRLLSFFRARRDGDRGATFVEYSLVVATVVVGAIVSIEAMEPRIEEKYEQTADDIGNPDLESFATPAPPSGGGSGGGATGGGGSGTPAPPVQKSFDPASSAASSTDFGGDPSRLTDGDTNGNFGGDSVAHTDSNQTGEHWFKVGFDTPTTITEVRIFNRTDDCCDQRQQGLSLEVDGVVIEADFDLPAGASSTDPYVVTFAVPLEVEEIRIFGTPPEGSYQIAEIEAYYTEPSLTEDDRED